MAKVPLAAVLSVQVLVALVGIVAIVVVFSLMHNDAVSRAAQDQTDSSVKYAQELISAPFRTVIPQVRAMAVEMEERGDFCNDARILNPGNGSIFTSMMQQIVPVMLSNAQYFAVYQSYRFPFAYSTAPTGTRNNQDFPWSDCGCLYGSPDHCFLGTYLPTPRYPARTVGWNVLPFGRPVNATITEDVAFDSREFTYIQTITGLNRAHAAGVWGRPELYPLVTANLLIPYITFHVPLQYDSVTGNCTLAANSDISLEWLAQFLVDMNIPSTRTIVIDRNSNVILATSFNIPPFLIPNASEPLTGFNWPITGTPDSTLNEAVQRVLDHHGGNLSALSQNIVLRGKKTIVGAGPVVVGALSLATIIVTENDLYFAAGRRAQIIAIVVGLVVFVALAATVAGTVFATVRPLQDISRRLRNTAQLKKGDELTDKSPFTEIRSLQKAYTNMNVAVQSFVRYVPKDVVVDLMHTGQLCEIAMVPMQCTMLFIDIINFTSLCERVPASTLSTLVLNYFNAMSAIVMRHSGLIDKFIGDCIMAVWGAPFGVPNHELKAILCALMLQRETLIDPLKSEFNEAGEMLGARVGVHTGEVLAGNMGSVDRMNYTVIGDAVNLTARLEGLGKQFGCTLLTSGETLARAPKVFCSRFVTPIYVVGKSQPVDVYEVWGVVPERSAQIIPAEVIGATRGRPGDESETASISANSGSQTSGNTESVIQQRNVSAHTLLSAAAEVRVAPVIVSAEAMRRANEFTNAVELYLRREFGAAAAKLQELERLAGSAPLDERDMGTRRGAAVGSAHDVPAEQLLRWCTEYLKSPPDDNWDGVYQAASK